MKQNELHNQLLDQSVALFLGGLIEITYLSMPIKLSMLQGTDKKDNSPFYEGFGEGYTENGKHFTIEAFQGEHFENREEHFYHQKQKKFNMVKILLTII
jgi:hypothetical protein